MVDHCEYVNYHRIKLMPSPSADTKFVLSILKYLCQLKIFFSWHNFLSTLKNEILLHELAPLRLQGYIKQFEYTEKKWNDTKIRVYSKQILCQQMD
jgi:hypothetical protein